MAIFTYKNGRIRIYDAFEGADATAGTEVTCYTYDGATYTNQTAGARTKSGGGNTGALLSASGHRVYVGFKVPFTAIGVDITTAAVASGALTVKYWNASAWTAVTALSDGTASGGNTLAQDGRILFTEPSDWATNDPPTGGTLLYYVELSSATVPTTAPIAEYLAPNSGQYHEAAFSLEAASWPTGHARAVEILVLDREQFDSKAHYVLGPDDPLYEPLEIHVRALLDSTTNRTALRAALEVANPNTTNWKRTGISTKGDSKNDGTNANPALADTSKKTTCVQILWDSTSDIGWSLNETYFPPQSVTVEEADQGVILDARGLVYGTVTEITRFGYTENSLT